MRDDEVPEGIQAFVTHMLGFTSNIVSLNATGQPARLRSGLVIQREGRYYVITAAHELKGSTWSIETGITVDGQTKGLIIPLKGMVQPDVAVDAALCELDMDGLRRQATGDPLLKGKEFRIKYYRGPIDESPSPDEAYGFAAWNDCTYMKDLSILERQATFEVGMTFTGMNSSTGLFSFKLAGKHKGHKVYKGASGAPIADPEGKIVSIVLEGDEAQDMIMGLPLSTFIQRIGTAR